MFNRCGGLCELCQDSICNQHRHSISCMILVQTSHVPPNADSLDLDLDLDSSLITSRYPQRAPIRSGRTVKLCIWSKKVVGKRTWLSLRSKNHTSSKEPFFGFIGDSRDSQIMGRPYGKLSIPIPISLGILMGMVWELYGKIAGNLVFIRLYKPWFQEPNTWITVGVPRRNLNEILWCWNTNLLEGPTVYVYI